VFLLQMPGLAQHVGGAEQLLEIQGKVMAAYDKASGNTA
jgi:hypothetical protein